MSDGMPLKTQPPLRGGSSTLEQTDVGRLKKTALNDVAAIAALKNEIALLKTLHHSGIVTLLNSGETPQGLPWLETELAEANLRVALRAELNRSGLPGEERLDKVLRQLTFWLSDIAEALCYLHHRNILHLDIRPENILIFADRKCRLIDFGGAVALDSAKESAPSQLTPWFTHPKLAESLFSSKDVAAQHLTVPVARLSARLDLFSFGRTILAMLAMIDREFPDIISYNYSFLYLHLMACRLLDGQNLSSADISALRESAIQRGDFSDAYQETWLNFSKADLAEMRYRSSDELVADFAKLLYPESIFEAVPEINPSLEKRINIGDRASAPGTDRVLAILSHPVFDRLKQVPQLEMMDTIYPSANHTRFEHSIGVFRNTALYVHALYFDRYNPLFRQLGQPQLFRAILLAGLLHDLGQFPFGHTLEEAMPELRHERFTVGFLENPTQNHSGQTLRDIIESPHNGWNVPLPLLRQLLDIDLKGDGRLFAEIPPATAMAIGIIDGPIDADKLDYLQRDSHKCFLPYGNGIDEPRLITSLTIIARRDEQDNLQLALGCYEKGQSAAEALSFARYLLYRSIYWHHSSRALRCMLSAAAQTMKPAAKIARDIESLLGLHEDVKPVGTREMLTMIEKRAGEPGTELVRLLRERNFYKNVLTLHTSDSGMDLDKFRSACRSPDFPAKVQVRITARFKAHLAGSVTTGHSLLRPEKSDRALEILSRPLAILCDAPKPSRGAKEKLYFIPEPDRLKKNYLSRSLSADRVSDVWSGIHDQLMKFAARAMVFCHPEIRDPLMAALGPEGIEQAVREAMSV